MKSYRHLKLPVVWLAAVCCLGLAVARGGAASIPALPLQVPSWRPLSQVRDQGFEARLAQALNRRGLWRSLLASQKMAVALVDLADPKRPRFAQINGETMMNGASLPKLGILLTAYQGFADGSLPGTPAVRTDLIEMIRRSDNAAADRMVARLGLGRIEALLTSPRFRFYDAARGGGLWLGGSYGPAAAHRPEPLQGLIYAATASQVCRFYYLLAYGKLLNPEASRQMLKVLAFPDLHDKFVEVLERCVPPSRIFRKSGEWKIWHADSVLVWDRPGRRYILVCLVEHPGGETILRNLVPVAEQVLAGR